METLPLIQRGFASLPPSVTRCFFRADSACDDERSLKWLADPQRPGGPEGPIGVPVSADMTAPLHAVCAAVPAAAGTFVEDRPAETVHCTEVEFFPGDWPKLAQPLRSVALRIRKKQGRLFAHGTDTKVPGHRESASGGLGRASIRADPLALAEGGDDRARPRHHPERAGCRRPGPSGSASPSSPSRAGSSSASGRRPSASPG